MENSVDLLLIGKTGNGKSATGNSILQKKQFKTSASTTSVTSEASVGASTIRGRTLQIVDGPGVGDTRVDSEEATRMVLSSLEKAMALSSCGYNAFLIVLRFGTRFTSEDMSTVLFLKGVFGENFLKRFGIVVMTCGDNFQRESDETGLTFDQWLREQGGDLRNLLEECQNRAVIFNNVSKDPSVQEEQLGALLEKVDSLRHSSTVYTSVDFNKSSLSRKRLIVECQKPLIQNETQAQATELSNELRRLQGTTLDDAQIRGLENLLQRCQRLTADVTSKDQGTGALSDVINSINPTYGTISDGLKAQRELLQERARLARMEEERKQQEEQAQREHEERVRRAEEQRRLEEERMQAEREAARIKREEEDRIARERQRELERQLEEEREKIRQQEMELERQRQAAAASRPKSPPLEKKIVKEVERTFRRIGKKLRF